jgi:uncharacterized protein
MKNINKTTLFLILVFGISFFAAALFYMLGGQLRRTEGIVFTTFYMFLPMITTLIIEKLIHKEEIKTNLLISFRINKWFLVAWLVPPAISLGAFAISLLFPGVSYSPGMEGLFDRYGALMTPEQIQEMQASIDNMPIHPILMGLAMGLLAGITINAVAGFGEELGWRGFLVKQFGHMHFMKAALIIGVVWGFWHAPIILMGHNYPQFPVTGVFMMTIWCILLSPLFLYFTIKARSVIAAAVMHGTLNGTAGLAILLIEGGNDLTVGMSGLAGFISLIIFTAAFYIYDRFVSKEKVMDTEINQWLIRKYS